MAEFTTPTDRRSDGRSDCQRSGRRGNLYRELSKVGEKVTLVTNGTVGWSVGRKIGEVNKQNERV